MSSAEEGQAGERMAWLVVSVLLGEAAVLIELSAELEKLV